MQYLAFEFDNEKDLQDTKKQLWEKLGVTGEMGTRPLSGGRWRLEISSEKELRDSSLERFARFRADSGTGGKSGDQE